MEILTRSGQILADGLDRIDPRLKSQESQMLTIESHTAWVVPNVAAYYRQLLDREINSRRVMYANSSVLLFAVVAAATAVY